MTPVPAPDPTIQYWTLAVAALAAVAAIVAAVISGWSTSRRERSAWLRQEQTLAYEAFQEAAWAGLDEITNGAVATALEHAEFEGLDDSVNTVLAHNGPINDAARRIAVLGGPQSIRPVMEFVSSWSARAGHAVPLSGASHEPANQQRLAYIEYFSHQLWVIATRMRIDLGLVSRRARKNWEKGLPESPAAPPEHYHDIAPGEANQILQRWRVWTWVQEGEATVGPGYVTDEMPWAHLRLNHSVLFQPMAAMIRKPANAPWFLAIDSSLSPEQVDILERDIATVVCTFGRSSKAKYGGNHWVSGESQGERIYYWTMENAPQTA